MKEFSKMSFGDYLDQKVSRNQLDEPIAAGIKLMFDELSPLIKHGNEVLKRFEKKPCKNEKEYLQKLVKRSFEMMKDPNIEDVTDE